MGGIVKSVKSIVSKVTSSPIFKGIVNLGMSYMTGGFSGLLKTGLDMFSKTKFGSNLMSSFGGFAQKFLGTASSLFSGGGLGAISEFAKKATGTGDLLSMAQNIAKTSQGDLSKLASGLQDVAKNNISQIFAKQAASFLNF